MEIIANYTVENTLSNELRIIFFLPFSAFLYVIVFLLIAAQLEIFAEYAGTHWDGSNSFWISAMLFHLLGGFVLAPGAFVVVKKRGIADDVGSFFLTLICFLLLYMIVYIIISYILGGEAALSATLGYILSNVDHIVTTIFIAILPLLAAFGFLLASVSTRAVCHTYGIPFKMSYIRVRDFLDIFLEGFLAFMSTAGILWLMGETAVERIPDWQSVAIVFGSICFGVFYLTLLLPRLITVIVSRTQKPRPRIGDVPKVRDKPKHKILNIFEYIFKILFKIFTRLIVGLFVLSAILLVIFGFAVLINRPDGIIGVVLLFLYVAIVIVVWACRVLWRLSGENYGLFLIKTALGKDYVALVRHNKNSWLCMPCTIDPDEADGADRTDKILYSKSSYKEIIRKEDIVHIKSIEKSVKLVREDI